MSILPGISWVQRMVKRGDLTVAEAYAINNTLTNLGREAQLDPEDYFLVGQALMAGGQELGGGGAGTRSMIQLMNESDATTGPQLAIVSQIYMTSNAATSYQIRYHDTPLATATNRGVFRDRQWVTPLGIGPFIRVRQDNTVAAVGTIWLGSLRKVVGDTFQLAENPLVILGPGQGLILCSATDNQEIDGGFFWRELNLRIRQ